MATAPEPEPEPEEQESLEWDTPVEVPDAYGKFLIQAMRNVFHRTSHLLKGMGENANYSGSTATACLVTALHGKKYVVTANLGDSKALLIRGDSSIELTFDHTTHAPSEVARVEAMGKKIINHRLCGCLSITRAFGDHALIPHGLSQEPYCSCFLLHSEDVCLLVASDGLWDGVSETKAVELVYSGIAKHNKDAKRKAKTKLSRADCILESLMKFALSLDITQDNISTVVVDLLRANESSPLQP